MMVFHCLNTGESEPLGELYPCLGNERPSRAICIGIRRIGCFIFILYNIVVDLVYEIPYKNDFCCEEECSVSTKQ